MKAERDLKSVGSGGQTGDASRSRKRKRRREREREREEGMERSQHVQRHQEDDRMTASGRWSDVVVYHDMEGVDHHGEIHPQSSSTTTA